MTTAPVMVGPSPQGGGPVPFPDSDDVLADIGDRIRAERQARGWSETELGRRAGLGRNTVRRLENGDASLRCFVQTCAAMSVPVDVLLSPAWHRPEPKTMPGRSATRKPVSLSPRQAAVLREAASGESLAQVGSRLGLGAQAVASEISRAYQRLGVAYLPREQRRAAAIRVAMQHGLFNPPKRTS